MKTESLMSRATETRRESRHLDFKESFDTDSNGDWCEVIKDVVAMANSGGGIIVFGVMNNGSISAFDPRKVLTYDPAKITDKLARYTSRQFADFEVVELVRHGSAISALVIKDAGMPMIFVKAGTYLGLDGREKTAFQAGTVYVRHGAKSEPATPDDLSDMIERQVEGRRKLWLHNVKRVMTAPASHDVVIVKQGASDPMVGSSSVARVVTEKGAPGFFPAGADSVWPYRGKDLLQKINQVIGVTPRVNNFDVKVIREVYDIEKKHPDFVYRPFSKSPAQYSETFVEWLVAEYRKDNQFFAKTRDIFRSK